MTTVGLLLTGCLFAHTPQSLTGPPLTPLYGIDVDGAFAADPAGGRIAFADRGLALSGLDGHAAVRLDPGSPVALAWHPDGTMFAAAFPVGDEATRIARYSAAGALLSDQVLPVVCDRLAWSLRGDLLVVGHTLKVYSFGGNLRQVLYQVTQGGVEETLLSDTTLKPTTVSQLGGHLERLLPVAFADAGDELVHVRLHDPPEFPAYLQLVHRHWQTGGERLLRRLPVQPVSLVWTPDATAVAVAGPDGKVLRVPVWPAVDRDYEAADLQASPERERLQILADGSYLLVERGRLYRGSGLPRTERPGYDETDWTLRRWRFEGLITPEEYAAHQRRSDL